jgi:hypothetical protein
MTTGQPVEHKLTRFSLRNVSTVVPACMIALEQIVALWQTLFLISTACFIVFRIRRSDLSNTQPHQGNVRYKSYERSGRKT